MDFRTNVKASMFTLGRNRYLVNKPQPSKKRLF